MFFYLLSFGFPGIFLKSTFLGLNGPHETKKKEIKIGINIEYAIKDIILCVKLLIFIMLFKV
mgnify:CR=1 FL=1